MKTVDVTGEDHVVENKWQASFVDVVVYIVRDSIWGCVMPAFTELKGR